MSKLRKKSGRFALLLVSAGVSACLALSACTPIEEAPFPVSTSQVTSGSANGGTESELAAEVTTAPTSSQTSEPVQEVVATENTAAQTTAPVSSSSLALTSSVSSTTTAAAAATTTTAVTTATTTPETTTTTTTTTMTTTASTTTTTTTPVATTAETTAATPVSTTTAPAVTISTGSSYQTLNYGAQYGMWISFLEFQNILKGKSQAQFTAAVQKMYDNCKAMGINTVYVHARSHSDAFYQSSLYPWSENASGALGKSPGFDPYTILVQEAHNRGMSFHAWINPMRGLSTKDMESLDDSFLIKQWYDDPAKKGTYIVEVDGTWYCSPAYPEVRNLIVAGVQEIIAKYPVDGVHIDDYFYPTTAASFDKAAFAASGSSNLTQWRLDTVSQMVKALYQGIKKSNSTVLFGVSPAGNIQNNYDYQYADVKKWCGTPGYLDYIVPQIYFGFKNATQPYEANLGAWRQMCTAPGVKLVVGLAAYKIGSQESTGEWAKDTEILARQIQVAQQTGDCSGAAFFRYESLFAPASSVKTKVNAEMDAIQKAIQQ